MSSNKIMSPELSKLFDEIQHEVNWLHAKWINYRQIYAQDEEQINLLNRISPSFFYILQIIFLSDTYLHISRLTDPAYTMGKENLSLERLVQSIESIKYKDLVDIVLVDLEKIKSASKPFRDLRNLTIAHIDLKVALKVNIDPIPGIGRQMVEDVLLLIRQLMNHIEIYFKESETAYELVITRGDGVALVYALKDVETYREEKRKKMLANKTK